MPAYQELLPLFDAYPQKVKDAKEAQKLTNADLADRSGVSASAVNKLLAGSQVDPKLFNTVALCKVLGLSIDRLFNLEPPQDTPEALREKVHEMELDDAHKDAEITRLQTVVKYQTEQLRTRKTSMLIMLCLCSILTVALVAYILIDSGIPDAGLIRFGNPTAAAWIFFAIIAAAAVAIVWGIVRYARSK